jgi:predicted pyridoxine 5'-phosphate oxidase superfamily flavin-nucleotide-binding protein
VEEGTASVGHDAREHEHGRAADAVTARSLPGSDGEHLVQEELGTTARAARFYGEQMLDHLNVRMREFVAEQEMFFLATSDRHGECDNSFRAGPPGFLTVLDARTLLYPEYRGNGVHASLGNIRENPHVGLLLVDFERARIGLHVNGTAEVVQDADARAAYPGLPLDPVPGRRAQLWVRVCVEEAYIHCAKHIPHMRRVSREAARDWGTDDYKRKGGDFFGAARDARTGREPGHPPARREPVVPAPDPQIWREEARRALAEAENRGRKREPTTFEGWFV